MENKFKKNDLVKIKIDEFIIDGKIYKGLNNGYYEVELFGSTPTYTLIEEKNVIAK